VTTQHASARWDERCRRSYGIGGCRGGDGGGRTLRVGGGSSGGGGGGGGGSTPGVGASDGRGGSTACGGCTPGARDSDDGRSGGSVMVGITIGALRRQRPPPSCISPAERATRLRSSAARIAGCVWIAASRLRRLAAASRRRVKSRRRSTPRFQAATVTRWRASSARGTLRPSKCASPRSERVKTALLLSSTALRSASVVRARLSFAAKRRALLAPARSASSSSRQMSPTDCWY
jgi:hypothetical protein